MAYTINLNMILAIFDKIPSRLNVGLLLFMTSFVTYMLRVNFSIVIIKMTTSNSTTEASDINLDDDDTFDWDKKDQGLLLSSYFYGYIVPNLLGGSLAEIYGGRIVIFIAIFLSAFITALSPFAANDNFVYMFIMRLILGILAGLIFPASHHLISKWSPPNEKGKFVFTLMGGIFGTVVTWPITGYLIEYYGWRMGFHMPAVVAFIISFVWLYFVHDSPQTHPRISKEEKKMIENSIGCSTTKKTMPPFNEIFTCYHFYALLLLHFGGTFGLFFLITAAPKFMSEVLNFKLTEAGILSAIPYLARFIFGFVFGSIGDHLKSKKVFNTTTIRKTFCLFSHLIPGLFLISLTFVGCNPYVCVAIITLSLGFNGAATMTNLQNSQDLAPNYAGQIYGIINFVGTMSGFISPLIVAYFTQNNSSMNEWQWIFITGGIVYIVPALLFMTFGSGEVQKWNEISNKNHKNIAREP